MAISNRTVSLKIHCLARRQGIRTHLPQAGGHARKRAVRTITVRAVGHFVALASRVCASTVPMLITVQTATASKILHD